MDKANKTTGNFFKEAAGNNGDDFMDDIFGDSEAKKPPKKDDYNDLFGDDNANDKKTNRFNRSNSRRSGSRRAANERPSATQIDYNLNINDYTPDMDDTPNKERFPLVRNSNNQQSFGTLNANQKGYDGHSELNAVI